MEFQVRIEGLDALRRNLERYPQIAGEEYRRAMEESVLIAEGEIATRTPVDRGRLRNSIQTRVTGSGLDLTGYVETAPLEYAPYVEFGTRPHAIRPRTKKALALRVGGAVIVRRRVRHPGTQGRHMFRDGTEAARPRINERFEAATVRVLKRVANG